MNMTANQYQKQRPTEANTVLNRSAMTLDEWRERMNACHHIDDPVAFRAEKKFLDAVAKEKGFLPQGLGTSWGEYFHTLVGQLLRGRDPVKSINGTVLLTFDNVLDKALADRERLWSAYRFAVEGRDSAAINDLKQAMRTAAIELVLLYKDDLDIEGARSQKKSA